MRRNKDYSGGFFLFVFIVAVIGVVGWVKNIIALVALDAVTGFALLRAVGIFVAPLGAVLGYL